MVVLFQECRQTARRRIRYVRDDAWRLPAVHSYTGHVDARTRRYSTHIHTRLLYSTPVNNKNNDNNAIQAWCTPTGAGEPEAHSCRTQAVGEGTSTPIERGGGFQAEAVFVFRQRESQQQQQQGQGCWWFKGMFGSGFGLVLVLVLVLVLIRADVVGELGQGRCRVKGVFRSALA